MNEDDDKVLHTRPDPSTDLDGDGEDGPQLRDPRRGELSIDAASAPDPGYAAFHDEADDSTDALEAWPTEADDRPLEALADELADSLSDFDADHEPAPRAHEIGDPVPARDDVGDELPLPGRMESLFDDPLPAPGSATALPEAAIRASGPADDPVIRIDSGEVEADIIEDLLADNDRHTGKAAELPPIDVPIEFPTAVDEDPDLERLADEPPGTAGDTTQEDAVIDALAEEAFRGKEGEPLRSRATPGATAEGPGTPHQAAERVAGPVTPPQDDLLVDDFLAGLDDDDDMEPIGDPLSEPTLQRATSVEEEPLTTASSALEAAGEYALRESEPPDTTVPPRDLVSDEEPQHAQGDREGRANKPGWSASWTMLGAVAIALGLLGVGGFGVLEQRRALQEEIRDLQARLSTAVTPEQATRYREREAELELRNENLSGELARVSASNQQLTSRVETLESALRDSQSAIEEQREQAAAAVEEAQAAAREATAVRAERAAPAEAPRTGAEGPWFVNFGSYAARSVAEDWARRLDVDTGRVVIQAAESGGRSLYRLRVVGLGDRDTAERVALGLERRFDLPRLWIGRN